MEPGDARRVEESMQRAQRAMLQAMVDLERQEAEKFGKVYQILEELSAKQVKLERDVASLLCSAKGNAFPMAAYDPSQCMVQCQMNGPWMVDGNAPQKPEKLAQSE